MVSYRFLYIGLGLLAVAAVSIGIVFSPEGEPTEIPLPIEAVFPLPNDVAIRQAVVEVDLEVGYVADVFVDGYPVIDANFEEATGVYSWSPSPNSPIFTEWTPGEHAVRVVWRKISGAPDFGEFEWTFRIQ